MRQPIEPMEAPFSRTADFEAIPRAYIRCAEDDVIPTPFQDEMVDAYPGTETVSLKRSHFPQFQDPGELAATIKILLAG